MPSDKTKPEGTPGMPDTPVRSNNKFVAAVFAALCVLAVGWLLVDLLLGRK